MCEVHISLMTCARTSSVAAADWLARCACVTTNAQMPLLLPHCYSGISSLSFCLLVPIYSTYFLLVVAMSNQHTTKPFSSIEYLLLDNLRNNPKMSSRIVQYSYRCHTDTCLVWGSTRGKILWKT
jgi:hypothetical protein